MYISDGYTNGRVAKFDKRGAWVKAWGTRGTGGADAGGSGRRVSTGTGGGGGTGRAGGPGRRGSFGGGACIGSSASPVWGGGAGR